jgi:hypothetical protein
MVRSHGPNPALPVKSQVRVESGMTRPAHTVRPSLRSRGAMAKRTWFLGSLCVIVGILVGHVLTRAGMSSARPPAFESAGISRAISVPQAATQKHVQVNLTDLAFCHKISSFGNYLKYDRDEFTPGQEVLLYAEIGKFRSELIPEGQFRTLLKSKLEFFRDGKPQEPAALIDLPETEDLCRQPRRDYFHSYQFAMPETLTEGRYTLRLTVQDQLGHSETSRSLTLAIR